MRSKIYIIKILFFLLSAVFFYRLVDLNLLSNPAAFNFKGLESRINFSADSKNRKVQFDYYSELTKGFSEGKLGFSVLPEPDLLKMENPYGKEAAELGLILQDASLYNNHYYIYYGVPPVLLLYLPIYKIFGFIPTDAFVVTILAFLYIILINYLSLLILKNNVLLSLIFFFSFLFNPVWMYGLNFLATAGVARLFCALCLTSAYLLLLKVLNERRGNFEIPVIFLLLSTAAITRPTYIPDCIVILLFLSYRKFKGNTAQFGLGALIAGIIFSLSLLYNFLRFDSFFENGQKYIVNGEDYLHKGSILKFPKVLFNIFYNFIYRMYEFFFSFPSLASDGSTHLNMQTKSPIMIGAYSEGIVGYFIYNPALFFALLLMLIFTYKNWAENINKGLILVSAFLLTLNLLMISQLQLSALHFILEYIPRLMLFYFFMACALNKAKITTGTLFNILWGILLAIPFQLALQWRSF